MVMVRNTVMATVSLDQLQAKEAQNQGKLALVGVLRLG